MLDNYLYYLFIYYTKQWFIIFTVLGFCDDAYLFFKNFYVIRGLLLSSQYFRSLNIFYLIVNTYHSNEKLWITRETMDLYYTNYLKKLEFRIYRNYLFPDGFR